jgi:hypothetical protein
VVAVSHLVHGQVSRQVSSGSPEISPKALAWNNSWKIIGDTMKKVSSAAETIMVFLRLSRAA